MRLTGNFEKKFKKKFGNFFLSIFSFLRAFVSSCRKSGFRVFLSLRYGADLGRSRLVSFLEDFSATTLSPKRPPPYCRRNVLFPNRRGGPLEPKNRSLTAPKKIEREPFALSFHWPDLASVVLVVSVKSGPISVRSGEKKVTDRHFSLKGKCAD